MPVSWVFRASTKGICRPFCGPPAGSWVGHRRQYRDSDDPDLSISKADFEEKMMEKCGEWLDEVRTLAEIEYATRFFDRLKTVFSRWIRIHYAISGLLFALMIVHVMTTVYYGLRWLP